MSVFCGKFQYGKVIITLVLIVLGLQVFHMGLLMRLESKGAQPHEHYSRGHMEEKMSMNTKILASNVVEKITDVHVSDSSGMYHIIPNIISPKLLMNKFSSKENIHNITLVTQTSSNHLDNLILLSQRWEGPISVSVFTHKDDAYFALISILYLRLCYSNIEDRISFHLVYPMDSAPSEQVRSELPGLKIECKKPFSDGRKIVENYAISGIQYPNNLLRNIALKSSATSYVFVIDIDLVPSPNLTAEFMKFIERRSKSTDFDIDKSLFVIPCFESKGLLIPSSKSDLLKAWESETIRPFYFEACWKCQKLTEFDRWKKLFQMDIMDIGYNVEWKDPWEPFFIASKNTPIYDERFKQYGFNRRSQICELHVAGYNFAVLNNAFLVHKGFKVKEKFHRSKDLENDRNRLLFRKFKEELKVRYPYSSRRC